MSYFVFNHQTHFKKLNRKVNRRKIVYNTYPNYLPFLLIFLTPVPSFCCYSPSVEEFFSNLLVRVSWQPILLAFLHLKTSLFYLHSQSTFPVRNSEPRVLSLKNFKMLFTFFRPSVVSTENSSHVNHCSPLGFLWLFSKCFFFVLSFKSLIMMCHRFLCVYSILDSLSLNLCVFICFIRFGRFAILFLQIFPGSPFVFSFQDSVTWTLDLLVLSQVSEALFIFSPIFFLYVIHIR